MLNHVYVSLVYSYCSFGNTKRRYLTFRHPLMSVPRSSWIVANFTMNLPLVLPDTVPAVQEGVVYTPRFTPERIPVNIRVHQPGKSAVNSLITGNFLVISVWSENCNNGQTIAISKFFQNAAREVIWGFIRLRGGQR